MSFTLKCFKFSTNFRKTRLIILSVWVMLTSLIWGGPCLIKLNMLKVFFIAFENEGILCRNIWSVLKNKRYVAEIKSAIKFTI